MAHVSLYRRYRPQTFADIVGQPHVTDTLSQALTEDRLHHAYLFTGPRGTGKTSTARILAKAVNCVEGPTPKPCNVCAQCVSVTAGSNIDVIEIDAASHGGVDDVRDLRERVAFAPAGARMKVYIVDECHMLSTAGWNAFLKTVEEPPDHVLFVFATTEPHKVLATILSRTQRFDFRRIDNATLAARVEWIGQQEDLTFDVGSVALITRAGDGSARDTESVLEQVVSYTGSHVTVAGIAEVLGSTDDDLLAQMADAVTAGDVAALCTLVQHLADAGHDLRQFTRDATEHLRALFLLQSVPDGALVAGTPERIEALRAQASRLGQVELLRAVDLLAEAQAQMRRGNTRLPLELALAKAALPESSGDPAALAARIDRLERRGGVQPASPMAGPSVPAAEHVQAAEHSRPGAAIAAAEIDAPAAPAEVDAPVVAAVAVTASDEVDALVVATASDEPIESDSATAAVQDDTTAEAKADGTDAGAVGFDLVLQSWPAVLDQVKQRTVRFYALLGEARPVGLDDGALTLEFRPGHRFHADECGGKRGQEIIGGALHDVLGMQPRLRCVVASAEASAASATRETEADAVAEREALEASGDLPDAAQVHRDAIATLQRSLGATVVDLP